MTAIPALSRLRRVSDDALLAERLEPPYTPLTWPEGGAYPPTDVYAEVIDTDGQTHRTPNYRTPDAALFRYAAGDPIAALGGTFTRASSATYTDADGIIRTAAAGVLRDNHYVRNPVTGLMERSVLLEGQRTNLCTWGSDFTAHIISNVDLTTGHADPTGGAGATRMAAHQHPDAGKTGVAHSFRIFRRLDMPLGATITRSVWVKRGTNPKQANKVVVYSQTVGSVHVDLNTLTYALQNGASAGGVTEYTGGWLRVWVTGVVSSTVNQNHFVYLSDRDIAASETSDPVLAGGEDIYIWGDQIEEGPFASSYIPTNGTPVTRAADSLGGFAAPAGTLYRRSFDPRSGAVSDAVLAHAGGALPITTPRAYTHLLVAEGTRTLSEMRRLAGVPA